MMDIVLLGTAVVFFALCFAYARACDRLWKEGAMIFDYVLSGAVTVFLTVYLTYALIRPERFW